MAKETFICGNCMSVFEVDFEDKRNRRTRESIRCCNAQMMTHEEYRKFKADNSLAGLFWNFNPMGEPKILNEEE
jgi:hypothetical protein